MHIIRTFILRLLVDPAEPEALRGDLRSMPHGEAQPFANEEALLALLRRPISEDAPPPADRRAAMEKRRGEPSPKGGP